jgi:uncharacterized Tic20 family protein
MSRHRSEPPADWLPSSDQVGYASAPDHQPGPEYPEAPGYPAISHDEYAEDREAYGVVADRDGVDRYDPEPGEYGVVYDDYGVVPEPAGDGAAARWAMLGYLTVPMFGFVVPFLVYLRALRGPRWSRAHAAQALNVWITAVLYGLSAVVMGAMLALDSPRIALIVFGSLAVALWLIMLIYLVRAATAASQGLRYTVPRWLCSPIVR